MTCRCHIIPPKLLERLARDKALSSEQRKDCADTVKFEQHWRKLRSLLGRSSVIAAECIASRVTLAAKPAITVYDCATGTALPGRPIAKPADAGDKSAVRAYTTTTGVADFYREVFGRNSVDARGMTLQSSIHYGRKYNNAFWNGGQMVYGDGDGEIFLDFTRSNDVIGHELTHGVTQFSAQLEYSGEAGGLNESISDVFGSMFRQWSKKQTVAKADWLIGSEIMGPDAKSQGYTCLRDMADPGAKHCLAPQPSNYKQYKAGMDPHDSSGFPNLAFYKAAMAIGGKSWEKAGRIWYQALTGYPPSPRLKMKAFAERTRQMAKSLYPAEAAVYKAVDQGWSAVGL